MTRIDISQLPPPDFLSPIDYEQELAQSVADLLSFFEGEDKTRLEETLARDSEPVTKILQLFAYRRMLDRQKMNDRSRRLLLAYAAGSDLDHIGITYYMTQRLEGELDNAYLERLLLAPDRYSTAGARRSYEFHARSASADVLDVRAENAGAGAVSIVVLSRIGDGTASPSLIATVQDALSGEDVRPLNDTPIVSGATIRPYAIRAVVTPMQGPDSQLIIEESRKNAERYADRRRRLGLSVLRDAVLASLWTDQVEHVELIEPIEDMPALPGTSCFCTEVELS